MYASKLRLENKVAIITGAGCVGPGWGNGRAMAVRFAQEGAKVFADAGVTAAYRATSFCRKPGSPTWWL